MNAWEILRDPNYRVSVFFVILAAIFALVAIVLLLRKLMQKMRKGEEAVLEENPRKKDFRKRGKRKKILKADTGIKTEEIKESRTKRPAEKGNTAILSSEEETEENYRNHLADAYRNGKGILAMLTIAEKGYAEDSVYGKRIRSARAYLENSRYKDFETALYGYLLSDSELDRKFARDLLQLEIVKYRRISMRQTVSNLDTNLERNKM